MDFKLRSLISYVTKPILLFSLIVLVFDSCREIEDMNPNRVPSAQIEGEERVPAFSVVALSGAASSDPDGDSLRYSWELINKPETSTSEIDDNYIAETSFIPDTAGIYLVRLSVSDGINSDADSIEISAFNPNSPPVANAGPDQSVQLYDSVFLDGSESFDPDGDSLLYTWEFFQRPEGSTASLTNADNTTSSFFADVDGLFQIILTVNDSLASDTDTVIITVQPNLPPVADAGPDQTVELNETVMLDGSDSSDPEDDSLSYLWEFLELPAGSNAILSDPEDSTTSFFTDVDGLFRIMLTVGDSLSSDSDTVDITVNPNLPPVADAGQDREVDINEQVILDASNSSDPENDTLTFTWNMLERPAGSSTTITDPNSIQALIIPDSPGQYIIELVVADNFNSDSDTIILTTAAPRINGITPNSGQFGTEVTLSGVNFSNDTSLVDVFFNGVPAEVIQAAYNQVTAVVPEGAGTGPVTLTTRGETATGPVFTYLNTITVSTFAGDGTAGFTNGTGNNARFNRPSDIAIDENDNLYVTDWENHTIRMITPDAVVSTYAGNGQQGYTDATGQQAQFNEPFGIDIAQDGTLYVTDFNNQRVRIINTSQTVSTLTVEGPNGAQDAIFNYPGNVALDESNNKIYISEIPASGQQGGNHRIMVVENDSLNVLAGGTSSGFLDGQGANALFNFPVGIILDENFNILVADALNNSLREITPSGQVTTLSGDGTDGLVNGSLSEARYDLPFDLYQTPQGEIFVADAGNFVIRKIDENNTVSTFAGEGTQGYTDGDAETAQFNTPYGLAVDSQGNIYVADVLNHVIRKITIR